jgi:ABC-type antimicrobial peptide transport system permease subunit
MVVSANQPIDQLDVRSRRYVVVSQSLAETLEASPLVGSELRLDGEPYQIAGIVKDYRMDPNDRFFQRKQALLVHQLIPSDSVTTAVIRSQPGALSRSIPFVRTKWAEAAGPEAPFQPESWHDPYEAFEGSVSLISSTSLIALLIAGLGLFSLSTLAITRRAHEVSIRKICGATPLNIVRLVVKEFLILVLMATLLAWPLGHIASINLLNRLFSPQAVGVGLFARTGVVVLLLTLVSVGFQAYRAAQTNPAQNLRLE